MLGIATDTSGGQAEEGRQVEDQVEACESEGWTRSRVRSAGRMSSSHPLFHRVGLSVAMLSKDPYPPARSPHRKRKGNWDVICAVPGIVAAMIILFPQGTV